MLEPIYSNQNKHYEKATFTHCKYSTISPQYTWITEHCYILYPSSSSLSSSCTSPSSSITLLYLTNSSSKHNQTPFTLLYSHGHSSSLGQIYSFLYDISTQLKCDVIAYDYIGYGYSQGEPSEKNIKISINTVYSFILNTLKIKASELILLGQTIGTFPTMYISSKQQKIAGAVVISPIASETSLIECKFKDKNTESLSQFNKHNKTHFNNLKYIHEIKCPMLFIHGMKDTNVPYKQSLALIKNAKCEVMKWFPQEGHHGNIFQEFRNEYILQLKEFITKVTNHNITITKS